MKLHFCIDQNYDKRFVNDAAVLSYVDSQYETASPFLALTRDLYQKSWDEINDGFSDFIEKTTGYAWFYETYECVVSVIHSGISNWGGTPKIIRGWKENPYSMRRITAHELILSHYFEIHRRHYTETGLSDGQIWALAEIAAFALTSLAPEARSFWPWDTEYYTNHNYPQIVTLQNALKPRFVAMKHFDEYITAGISLVREYPAMSPDGA